MTEKLAELLKRTRRELDITLRIVQEKTGISNAYLSQMENGRIGSPSPNVLFKLANLYNLSYDRLLELAGHPIRIKKEVSTRFGDNIEDLSDEDKERVLDYIKFLKSSRR